MDYNETLPLADNLVSAANPASLGRLPAFGLERFASVEDDG